MIIICLAIIASSAYLHWKQQQTIDILTNKLMARSLTEYKDVMSEPVASDPVIVDEEEEYHREIEAMKQC